MTTANRSIACEVCRDIGCDPDDPGAACPAPGCAAAVTLMNAFGRLMRRSSEITSNSFPGGVSDRAFASARQSFADSLHGYRKMLSRYREAEDINARMRELCMAEANEQLRAAVTHIQRAADLVGLQTPEAQARLLELRNAVEREAEVMGTTSIRVPAE